MHLQITTGLLAQNLLAQNLLAQNLLAQNNAAQADFPVAVAAAAVLALFVLWFLAKSVKIVQEYERGVIFRLGRCVGAKGPGIFLVIPVIDKIVKTNLQIIAVPVSPQSVITKDNVTVSVDAVAYFQVIDPQASVVKIRDWYSSSQLVAQTTLRSIVGRHELDQLLSERDRIDSELQTALDQQTEPWGIKVHRVEIRDVGLPEQMQRAMARQAEAERERRAKIIAADGEFQASQRLAQAATVIATAPGALQLRQLQTLAEISTENSSTIVFPIPVQLLDAFHALAGGTPAPPSAGGTVNMDAPGPVVLTPTGPLPAYESPSDSADLPEAP